MRMAYTLYFLRIRCVFCNVSYHIFDSTTFSMLMSGQHTASVGNTCKYLYVFRVYRYIYICIDRSSVTCLQQACFSGFGHFDPIATLNLTWVTFIYFFVWFSWYFSSPNKIRKHYTSRMGGNESGWKNIINDHIFWIIYHDIPMFQ